MNRDRPKHRRLNLQTFREARRRARYPQQTICYLLGHSHNWLSRIERGERQIGLHDYLACCELYGIKLDECLEEFARSPEPERPHEDA